MGKRASTCGRLIVSGQVRVGFDFVFDKKRRAGRQSNPFAEGSIACERVLLTSMLPFVVRPFSSSVQEFTRPQHKSFPLGFGRSIGFVYLQLLCSYARQSVGASDGRLRHPRSGERSHRGHLRHPRSGERSHQRSREVRERPVFLAPSLVLDGH
jgi:hypothetical protein